MGNIGDLRLVQIGRDFHRQRHIAAVFRVQAALTVFQRFQQAAQFVPTLQRAQVFGVRR